MFGTRRAFPKLLRILHRTRLCWMKAWNTQAMIPQKQKVSRAPSLTSMVCRKNVHPRVWRNNIQLVCSTNDHGIFEKSADLRVWWTSIHGKNWDRIASILWCHNVHLVWRTSIHVSKVWRISNHHYEGIKSGRQWYLLYMKWPDYCTIFWSLVEFVYEIVCAGLLYILRKAI